MNIYEAVKILNDATEKYDGFEFIAEPNFTNSLSNVNAHVVSCNLIFDDAPEALQICAALQCVLAYVYQNPPK